MLINKNAIKILLSKNKINMACEVLFEKLNSYYILNRQSDINDLINIFKGLSPVPDHIKQAGSVLNSVYQKLINSSS